jgi:hypothetical protein
LQAAFLRGEIPSTIFAEQLPIILASSPSDDEDVESWSRLFAQAHGLDFEKARREARLKRMGYKLAAMPERLLQRMNTKVIGSPEHMVANVYEASLAAAEARAR